MPLGQDPEVAAFCLIAAPSHVRAERRRALAPPARGGTLDAWDDPVPYERNADLPKRIRDSLPKAAQTIYRKAFNSAWKQYGDPASRRRGASREETAHRVAWSAVKSSYVKRDDRWVARASS